MTQPQLIQQAKQGNAKAIATLINHTLKPKGIQVVKYSLKEGCLKLMLEGETVPEQEQMTPLIRQGLTNLNSPVLQTVQLYGKKTNKKQTIWQTKINLHNSQETTQKTNSNVVATKPPPSPSYQTPYSSNLKTQNITNKSSQQYPKINNKNTKFKEILSPKNLVILSIVLVGVLGFNIFFATSPQKRVTKFLTLLKNGDEITALQHSCNSGVGAFPYNVQDYEILDQAIKNVSFDKVTELNSDNKLIVYEPKKFISKHFPEYLQPVKDLEQYEYHQFTVQITSYEYNGDIKKSNQDIKLDVNYSLEQGKRVEKIWTIYLWNTKQNIKFTKNFYDIYNQIFAVAEVSMEDTRNSIKESKSYNFILEKMQTNSEIFYAFADLSSLGFPYTGTDTPEKASKNMYCISEIEEKKSNYDEPSTDN